MDLKRGIIENLRPTLLDNLGLVAALRWLVSETGRRSGLKCHESYCDSDLTDLSAEANIALYRVAQECLTNIMKHAQATEVDFELECNDETITLTVTDNGRGIGRRRIGLPQSYGIAGMQHRVSAFGGRMSIEPGINGRGTTVTATIPREHASQSALLQAAGSEAKP